MVILNREVSLGNGKSNAAVLAVCACKRTGSKTHDKREQAGIPAVRSVKPEPIQQERSIKSAGLDWRDGDEPAAEAGPRSGSVAREPMPTREGWSSSNATKNAWTGGTNESADCAVRRNKGALGALAVLRPMMRMVAAAVGALTIMRCITVSRGRAILALAAVRMVRAAAHRQVNHQRRGDEDAAQPGHTTPLFTLYSSSAIQFYHLQPNRHTHRWWGPTS